MRWIFSKEKPKKRWVAAAGLLLAVELIVAVLPLVDAAIPFREPVLGLTFSKVYAESLGVPWKEAYIAILDELKPHQMRLPIYWSEVEPKRGEYQWEDADWMLREANARQVDVILAFGMKVPRWPECFIPTWASANPETLTQETVAYVADVAKRYKNNPAVVRFQVENEPLFPFGVCPAPDRSRLTQELAAVRAQSLMPIQLTVSGELELWRLAARDADVLGFSLYRSTYNPAVGYFAYPIPPFFYRVRSALARNKKRNVVVSELQAEPWFSSSIEGQSVDALYGLFEEEDLRRNVNYAIATGVGEISLWGPEWWYFLKLKGRSELWEAGKAVMSGK